MAKTLKINRYSASISGDPIDSSVTRHCFSAIATARAARSYAELGEIITIVGPRGGVTYWEAVGSKASQLVWRVSSPLAAAA
jgi:hypothetical protein